MVFEIIISPEAFAETNEIYLFYERASVGLGERFLESLEDIYKKLSKAPQYYGYTNKAKDIRDVKINGFPFVVIFQIVNDTVFVLRVFNTSRDPELLKNL
ncbi:MAG: type II toxin-antitoxin system RelE/ParE family toxin [Bacteroidota bacterium]|nr:type II toxin-antitoxin system RelE/ParE family toxin [Bacteroidota bacterium]